MSGVEGAGVTRIGFEGERDNLCAALGWLKKGVGIRPSVPILAGVLIDAAADGTVTVTTFNYDEQRTVRLDGTSVTEPGRVLVSVHRLYEIVNKGIPKGTRKAPAPPVVFTAAGETLVVTSGEATYDVDTMPVEDYPGMPAAPEVRGSIDAAAFAAGVARVAVSAGKDGTLPTLTGINLRAAGDGTLAMDATDRYRLGSFAGTWTPAGDGCEIDALIPAATLAEAGGLFAKAGGLVLIGRNGGAPHNDGAVSLSWGDGSHYLHTRIIDGEFPRVRSLYPDPSAYIATAYVDAAALAPVVKSIGANCGKAEPARLTFDGSAKVTVASDKGKLTAKVEHIGDTLTIGFNPTYLEAAIKAIGGRVLIGMTSPAKPAILRQVDADGKYTDGYRHLIMPVRIESAAPAWKPAAPAEAAPAPEPVAEPAPEPDDEISAEVARDIAARDAAVQAADKPEPEPEPVAETAPEPVAPVAETAPEPVAPVAETAPEPEPEPVAETAPVGPVARIAEILRTGEWSSDVVRLGKGRERMPVGVDVLKLSAGRLERAEYLAVADVLRSNGGGAWNKKAGGFIFEPSRAQFTGGYSLSGREALNAWLDRNAPTMADAAPVVEATPEPVAVPEPVAMAAPVVETTPEPAPVAEPEPVTVTGDSATITATVPAKRGPFDATLNVGRNGDKWEVTNTKAVRFTASKAWRPRGWDWNGTAWVKPDTGEMVGAIAAELAEGLTAAGVRSVVDGAPAVPVTVPVTVPVAAAGAPAPVAEPVTYQYDPTAPVGLDLDDETGRRFAAWTFTADDAASLKATAFAVRVMLGNLVTVPVNKGRGAAAERDAADCPANHLKVSVFRDNKARTLTVRAYLPNEGEALDVAALTQSVTTTTTMVDGVAALAA